METRRVRAERKILNGLTLTPREWELLELLAGGSIYRKAAEIMEIQETSIRVAMCRIYNRMRQAYPGVKGGALKSMLVRWMSRHLEESPILDTPPTPRPRQKDCRHEPSYPDHQCVVFCLQAPSWTAHTGSEICPFEGPHRIKDCAEWGHYTLTTMALNCFRAPFEGYPGRQLEVRMSPVGASHPTANPNPGDNVDYTSDCDELDEIPLA